jgi:ribulose 1,5-bisphosphate synthetase/thiazole synthase
MSPAKVVDQSYEDEVPILIVGGGPSGLLLAFMLAQLNGMYDNIQCHRSPH